MQGERGRQVERLVARLQRSQNEYRIVPVHKGTYAETLAAAIVALRSRQQPPIVQVVEVATATMMAAKGAIYPVHELMRDQGEEFDPAVYLPVIKGYYSDVDGNLLSFPFNSRPRSSTTTRTSSARSGSIPTSRRSTWPAVEAVGRKLVDAGVRCGITTEWPSWVHIENFSAYHDCRSPPKRTASPASTPS